MKEELKEGIRNYLKRFNKYSKEEYNSKPDSIVSVEDKMFWKPSSAVFVLSVSL